MVMTPSSVQALGKLWQVWLSECRQMSDAQWRLPTRCGEWDVMSLAAHVSSGVGGLDALVTKRVVDGPAVITTAAELIRAVKPSSDVAEELSVKVARSARDDADQSTAAELVHRFEQGVSLCSADSVDVQAVCDYFGRGYATVEAAVDLRVVEATVHLFDLQIALDKPLDAPVEGVRITRDFLTDLVPAIDFIEAATGRRPVDFFPVHS